MKKSNLNLSYHEQDGVLLPNICISDQPEDEQPLGRYGRMALAYLRENHPERYAVLKMDGNLMKTMHREYSFEARLIIILLSSTTSLYNLSSQKSYKFAEVPIAAFACISRRYGSTPSIGFHPRISSDFSKNTGLLHVPVLSVSTFIFLAGDNIIFISLIPAAYFPDRPLLLPCHLL